MAGLTIPIGKQGINEKLLSTLNKIEENLTVSTEQSKSDSIIRLGTVNDALRYKTFFV